MDKSEYKEVDPEEFYKSFEEYIEQGYRGFSQYIPMSYETLENLHMGLGDEKFHYIAANCENLAKEEEAKAYIQHFIDSYDPPKPEEKKVTEIISDKITMYRTADPSSNARGIFKGRHPAKPSYIILSRDMFEKYDKEMSAHIMKDPNKAKLPTSPNNRYKFHGIPILISPGEQNKIELI